MITCAWKGILSYKYIVDINTKKYQADLIADAWKIVHTIERVYEWLGIYKTQIIIDILLQVLGRVYNQVYIQHK